MTELVGKVAIVTGGGRGIGREHALTLARAGAAVVVNDLGGEFDGTGAATSGPADDVVKEIVDAGGRAVADTTDVSDWDAVEGLIQTAVSNFGRLDIVVNNAGISRFNMIYDVTRQDWERTVDVTLNATGAVCHWASAYWKSQGPEAGRRIVNTTSGVGLSPLPNNPMYVAAKAGVAALTVACAIELAELGVRVNNLAPVARSRISVAVAGELMGNVPEGFDPLSPEHAANLVAYLVSPQCRFTGRTFGVIGDNVTLFEGWSISDHFDNSGKPWTLEELTTAAEKLSAQHPTVIQAIDGTADALFPSDDTVAALAAVEGS